MQVSVCLGTNLNPEYVDFHSSYSAPRSRIAGIYSGIYSRIYSYSGISQTKASLNRITRRRYCIELLFAL